MVYGVFVAQKGGKIEKIEKLKKKTKSKNFQKIFCPKTLTSVFFKLIYMIGLKKSLVANRNFLQSKPILDPEN